VNSVTGRDAAKERSGACGWMVGNSETIKKQALLGCLIFEAYLMTPEYRYHHR
jgi:hypothetical protein